MSAESISAMANIANVASSFASNIAAIGQSKAAYKRQLEFWNLQNAYNTPSAQMQRLADAGLNPNLMYGQGNTGNAVNLSSVGAPKLNTYQLNGLQEAAIAQAQLDLAQQKQTHDNAKTDAETSLIKQQEKIATLDALKRNIEQPLWKKETDFKNELYDSGTMLKQYNTMVDNLITTQENLVLDTEAKRLNNLFNQATIDTRIKRELVTTQLTEQGLKNAEQTFNLLKAQTNLTYNECLKVAKEVELLTENITGVILSNGLKVQDINFNNRTYEKRVEKLYTEVRANILKNDMQALDNLFTSKGVNIKSNSEVSGLFNAAGQVAGFVVDSWNSASNTVSSWFE